MQTGIYNTKLVSNYITIWLKLRGLSELYICKYLMINIFYNFYLHYLIIYIAQIHNIGSRCLMGSKQCLP